MSREKVERILSVDLMELKNAILMKNDKPMCRYLWGPEGVGKSELINSWMDEIDIEDLAKKKIYYFKLNLKDIENTGRYGYWEIWQKLIMQFKETIPKEAYEYEADTIENIFALLENSIEEIVEEYDEDTKGCIDDLFTAFTSAKIHIKIVMYHFEETIRIFPKETDDGWFFLQLYDLSPKGGLEDKKLSILLISDCYATKDMIHHMEYHSDFKDGYNVIYLGGYRDKELMMYYEALETQVGGLSDEQRDRIEYYCGRHPKMLEIMYELLVTADGKNIDDTVLKEYYKKLSRNLEKRKHLIETESDEIMYEYGYLFEDYDSGKYMNLSEAFKEFK